MKDTENQLNFIGISGHLTNGATGHFEAFHLALFEAAQRSSLLASTEYLGSSLSGGSKNWFTPVVPPSTVSRISWCNKNFVNYLVSNVRSKSGPVVLHTYEGNLFWVLVTSRVIRASSTTHAYVNFFNSAKYNKILASPLRRKWFKYIFRYLVSDISSYFIFTADSQKMASKLETLTGFEFSCYPIYASLSAGKTQKSADKILVLIRGKRSIDILFRALQSIPNKIKANIIVHGVPTHEDIARLENEFKITVSKKHLSTSEYSDFYQNIFRVIILYDPEIFQDQSSGRLCDAIVQEKEVIVPRDTALFDMAKSYGTFESFVFGDFKRVEELISQPKKRTTKIYRKPTSSSAISEIAESVEHKATGEPRKIKSTVLELMQMVLGGIWLIVGILYKLREMLRLSR
jgi:hypothetical protein